ncbi:MAG: prepilin-type N-terminal cleavage/methylation domain-containing protein [Gammaproteobacteria bacterium]
MNILKSFISIIDHELKGFTLVELMIVMAIVAVLASIATASYQQQVLKARRAEAKTAPQQTVTP